MAGQPPWPPWGAHTCQKAPKVIPKEGAQGSQSHPKYVECDKCYKKGNLGSYKGLKINNCWVVDVAKT